MAHSAPAVPTPILTRARKKTSLPFLGFQRHWSAHQGPNHTTDTQPVHRRVFIWGLAGAVIGLSVGNQSANAAKRRPAPPPPEEKEKKDPNVSGVQAKVLASMKRKEAMEEAMAKLRAKGKPINQPSE
ncbi:hypothetical protein HHK36_013350 [Tetracentron sinense]|uniref:Uncharacterized protein n=1 Tax=Tetracentron sinense TaxID=13715 RepID=A0A834Z8N6_TETSI|nr:hypothetical protein HHK36_013350 [Tetracentron sinense]